MMTKYKRKQIERAEKWGNFFGLFFGNLVGTIISFNLFLFLMLLIIY